MQFRYVVNCCADVKKSDPLIDRCSELKAKRSLSEAKLRQKLEQLYELCLQEAVSIQFCLLLVAKSVVAILTSVVSDSVLFYD